MMGLDKQKRTIWPMGASLRRAGARILAMAVVAAVAVAQMPARMPPLLATLAPLAAHAAAQEDATPQGIADEVFGATESIESQEQAATTETSAGADTAEEPAAPAVPAASSEAILEIAESIIAESGSLSKEQKAQLLNRIGVMKGDPDRGLMLDIMVRRSDAAVFFARLLGQEQAVIDGTETTYATAPFPDTPKGAWYTPYISYCVGIGLIVGRTDGKYYPDDNISEKEFANVLLKILGYVYGEDYTWDTVYEFAYDIGLFYDPSYATRVEDNREYYRSDVSNEVFSVLGLEKKDSPQKLLEELVGTGALSREAVIAMGIDLQALAGAASGTGIGNIRDIDDYADIEEVYHLEKDLIWVIFTKAVTVEPENIEISQTYDFSMTLDAVVEDSSPYDLVIRTSAQETYDEGGNHMDYTIDISNVIEADGTNAGMLSFDFVGFDPSARADDIAGPTTKKRDPAALAAEHERPVASAVSEGDDGEGADGSGSGSGSSTGSGTGSGSSSSSGTGGAAPATAAGNADISTEYFRVINAYSVSSNQAALFFSQPVTDTALNATYYNIYHDGANVSSGASRQIKVQLLDSAVNAVMLTSAELSYRQGMQYAITVSGRLSSAYMARLNEGYDDSYVFTASSVTEAQTGFTLKSVTTPSQYAIDLAFSQPVDPDVARQKYVYYIEGQDGRRVDISGVSLTAAAGSSGGKSGGSGSAAAETIGVRLSVSQQILSQASYTLTIVYMQNAAHDAEIKNSPYQFKYAQSSGAANSQIAVTNVSSPDPSVVEVYFNQKPNKASAEATTSYSVAWPASPGQPSGTAAPAKATYDPVLSPYMVRLYFAPNSKLKKGVTYTLRVNASSFRDANLASPAKALETQFQTEGDASTNPALMDAVVVGENIVRLAFTKEIRLDQNAVSEANYLLEDTGGAEGGGIAPTVVKYVDPLTIVLKFDMPGGSAGAGAGSVASSVASSGGADLGSSIESGSRYRVRVASITDITGLYTSKYPDQGMSASLRAGKR